MNARQQVQEQATNTLINCAYDLALSRVDDQTHDAFCEKVRGRVSLTLGERGIFLIKDAVQDALRNR